MNADLLFQKRLDDVYKSRDRVFAWLMGAQWLLAIGIALVFSPYGWAGKVHATHVHVYYAVFGGAVLSLPIIALTMLRPGWVGTRHAVAVAQMLWSALLIHLTGGRIETHFHVFGSLAFLAFYRDWRVLLTGTLVVASEHLARGLWWPESVYGITNPEWWRFLEHATWVAFEDTVLVMGIVHNLREMRTLANQQTELEAVHASVEQKVVERTNQLQQSREQYRTLLETTRTVPWQMTPDGWRFTYVGPQGAALLGCAIEAWQAPGFLEGRVDPIERETVLAKLGEAARTGQDQDLELRLKRDDGKWVTVRAIFSASDGAVRGVLLDVTERKQLELELQQAQKLESVGRLAAGVAHEINTPVQFVSDNLSFVRDGITDVLGLIDRYGELKRLGRAPSAAELEALTQAEEQADLAYLQDGLGTAVSESIDGLKRVATIVRSMKTFAHPEQTEMSQADLNQALESTITIARNEYRYVADLETDFGELPATPCYLGELNQVFLNILVNASHAVGDVFTRTQQRGRIAVKTRVEGDRVVISISDSGGGIPAAIRDRVFDPFFTTKAVGKGTGQGLAIARSVVVDKHRGQLDFTSDADRGTTFFIRLPLQVATRKVAA